MSLKLPELPPADPGSRALEETFRAAFRILRVVMVVVMVALLGSGVFTVQPNEVATVLRFGKPLAASADRWLQPGLHFAFPYPIDEVVRIPVGVSHSVASSVGWYLQTPEQLALGQEPAARNSLPPDVDGYVLTADGNILHARALLKYRITDPLAYEFGLRTATNLLQNVLNQALVHASAQFNADGALYRDKLGFKEAVLAELNRSLEARPLGIVIDTFEVQGVAPLAVRPAFEEVLAAEQDRSRKINDARSYANEVTYKAAGEAQARVSAGVTASNQVVLAVAAEAAAFRAQRPHFEKNPALFRRRLLTEAAEQVMTNAQDKFILPARVPGSTREIRLQLNREPLKPKTVEMADPHKH